jgi:hypothetical protein
MGILTRKMEKDMELMKEQLRVDTPSDNIKKESLVSQAIKTANLPSEIQKSMGEMLRDRLKVASQSQQDDEELKKRVSEQLKTSDMVNMGTTMQRSDNSLLSKGKSLG